MDSPLFDHTIHRHVITLAMKVNRLDASCATAFKQQCLEICSPEIEEVDVNVSKVEFMDSSGVGALIGIYRRLPEATRRIKILNARPALRTLFEVLRLQKILEVV